MSSRFVAAGVLALLFTMPASVAQARSLTVDGESNPLGFDFQESSAEGPVFVETTLGMCPPETSAAASPRKRKRKNNLALPLCHNQMMRPVAGAEVGSGWGLRIHPISGELKAHEGVDFDADMGAPIVAAASGKVTTASDENDGYGIKVIIDHGDGLTTLYAHQSALAVSVGDQVDQGDLIGYVGSTGISTGPHLHFEVRIDGTSFDPMAYL